MQKLSKKQRKRIFVYCSKMPYFRDFLHISTSRKKCAEIFDSRTGHHTTILLNGFTEPFGSVSFCTDFGLGLYLVFIAKQQGSCCCSKSLISVTAEVLILNLWSLSRNFGSFAALLFFFVKDKCVGDCPARPCLCFLEHMTVDVRCR